MTNVQKIPPNVLIAIIGLLSAVSVALTTGLFNLAADKRKDEATAALDQQQFQEKLIMARVFAPSTENASQGPIPAANISKSNAQLDSTPTHKQGPDANSFEGCKASKFNDFRGPAKALAPGDLKAVADYMGIEVSVLGTLLTVESGRGSGFFPSGRPQLVFERAVFHTRTKGAFDVSHPDISAPTWGGYAGGEAEYDRLEQAMALSCDDALESAAWGYPQLMGFNYSPAGFTSVESFVWDSMNSERSQLYALARFFTATGIVPALKSKDWNSVALHYNGPGELNYYAKKLSATYESYQASR